MEAPGKGPGVQTKVVPGILLPAVKTEGVPAHTFVGTAVAVIIGLGLTVMVIAALLVQFPFEPVTVYVVVEPGHKGTVAPPKLPGIQL
jgi:hypothetical protein